MSLEKKTTAGHRGEEHSPHTKMLRDMAESPDSEKKRRTRGGGSNSTLNKYPDPINIRYKDFTNKKHDALGS